MNQPLLNSNAYLENKTLKNATNLALLDLATPISKAEGVQWGRTSNFTYYKVVIS